MGTAHQFIVTAVVTVAAVWLASSAQAGDSDNKANTSRAAREDAIRSIPLERLAPETRQRVSAVVENATVFRRLPIEVVDCEPELFHFMVRQPEVLVNIWQLMGLSNVSFDRIDDAHFRCSDGDGTTARGEFVWRNHDTQIVFAEGTYDGPLFPRTVCGQVVLVLKTASMRETNGRYYVTSRLDTFIHVDNVGIEIIAKMFQSWLGKTIDHNFGETVGFIGSISRSAETNPASMRRLAAKFKHVDVEHRQEFVDLTDHVGEKMNAVAWTEPSATQRGVAALQGPPAAGNRR